MTKYKHIIKYNLIIFFVIYLAIAIWSFLDKQIHMDELINSLYGAILLIIGIIPTGFAFTLVLITLQKKIMLDWLYKKRSNGRYSITQGGLPAIAQHKFIAAASIKKSLSPNVLAWLTSLNESQVSYTNLFLKVTGILKQKRNTLAELNEPALLYTHSKKVTDEIIKLQKMSDKEVIKRFNNDDNFNKYHLKIEDIIVALRSPLMVIIGICHDVGKLDSPIYPGQTSYLLDFGIRGRNLLAKLDETWSLPKDDYNDLFIVMANYSNYDNAPKLLKDGKLIFKSINATCLTVILLHCHVLGLMNVEINEVEAEGDDILNEVEPCLELATEVLSVVVTPIETNEVSTQRALQNKEFIEHSEPVILIDQVFKPVESHISNSLSETELQDTEQEVSDVLLNYNTPLKSQKRAHSEQENDKTEVKNLFALAPALVKPESPTQVKKPSVGQTKLSRPSLNSKYQTSKIRDTGNKPYSIHNQVNKGPVDGQN